MHGKLPQPFDPETMEDEEIQDKTTFSPLEKKLENTPDIEDNTLDQEEIPIPKVAHIQSQTAHHNEGAYSVRKESVEKFRWNGSIYITLAFAGIALLTAMIVGIILLRRHAQRSPHGQGFVEVDQAATPEERHVANMQVNGYENPTYKYFETQNN
ncbi:amyloid-beta-like protein [Centruroides sculpturatus]|nr:amyloid-beta-like protein [Centruroides sculpturatus]